ncbi:MAG: cytochrome P450 [Crocinitomicaceae bacterium]|nr:cytochrome P450 [Crocinitomicaceae bacterium]
MSITLKNLPGPKGYPLVGNIPNIDLSNLHNQIEQWAEEYGDVYRLKLANTSQTVITRPSLIQKILSARPNEFVRLKKMDRILREGGIHGVFNAEGDEWRLHRKIVAKGLDVKHQEQFYPSMVTTLERLYDKWSKDAKSGEPIDIQRDLMRFTVDVTTTLAFGHDMNTLEQDGGPIQEHMEKVFPMIFKRINSPIPFYRVIKSKSDKEFDVAVNEMTKLVDEFIESGKEKLKSNPELRENPSNVLEAILIAAEEEEVFTQKEVRGNLLTLLMAGEDTTAHTLTWLIYLLTIHTDAQDGIRAEADQVLGDKPLLTDYAANNELKYTEGAALESMRFKPVAPILLFQVTKDIEMEGIYFKKGQKILTQSRVSALKDDFFTAAKSFNPERWLKESKCPVHTWMLLRLLVVALAFALVKI